MSLLDDARRLENDWLVVETAADEMRCRCCQAVITATPANTAMGHARYCPWLSMPKIVTVIEAAKQMVDAEDGEEYHKGWMALVAAMEEGA